MIISIFLLKSLNSINISFHKTEEDKLVKLFCKNTICYKKF